MRSRQDQVILIFAIWTDTDTDTDADAGDPTFRYQTRSIGEGDGRVCETVVHARPGLNSDDVLHA